jgi:signal transduction histidine kinase
LKWYDALPFVDILKDAAKLPPRSAILWHLMNVDAAGVSHEENESLNALASVASAPIFSYDGSFFEGALVGGPMFSVMESSAVTANVANRILSGERAGDIKTQPVGFAAPRFDWRQMQRWGISEGSLPPGSTVEFRSPPLWQVYRAQIALVAAVFLLQGGLISGLLLERRRRHRAEANARQRMAELAHVNRYSTAGELTATITHEINQPLGSILINTESAESILRSASPDLNELKEILVDIRRDDERATDVIRRLRSLLKRTPFEARIIDLNATVKEAVDLLAPVMKQRNIAIQTRWSSGPLLVNADPIQIQQVVINLVRNGSDAISESAAAERVIDISTSKRGGSAELLVADSGGGIPADSLGKLFDPFFSTRKEGMGMGLSIVQTIVEAHEGTISAENVNRGATFRVKLPISKA